MDNRRIMHSIYFLLLLLLAALPGEPASAQSNGRESAEPETVIISGVATPRDHYTYRLEPFSVPAHTGRDRKSTRLNSSHVASSCAVFCLKKKLPSTGSGGHQRRERRAGDCPGTAKGAARR